jgi:hypothetical protein
MAEAQNITLNYGIEKSYTNATHCMTPTGDIIEKAKL